MDYDTRSGLRELAEAQGVGLQMLSSGQYWLSNRKFAARKMSVVAMDIADADRIAAIWIARHSCRYQQRTFVCTYAKDNDEWQPIAANNVPVEAGFLQDRGVRAISGPASLLVLEGSGGSLTGHSEIDPAWVGYQLIHAASEVSCLRIGQRVIDVPDHGHVIVVWKTAAGRGRPYGRPQIAAHASDGVQLTSLDTDGFIDSAVWDASL